MIGGAAESEDVPCSADSTDQQRLSRRPPASRYDSVPWAEGGSEFNGGWRRYGRARSSTNCPEVSIPFPRLLGLAVGCYSVTPGLPVAVGCYCHSRPPVAEWAAIGNWYCRTATVLVSQLHAYGARRCQSCCCAAVLLAAAGVTQNCCWFPSPECWLSNYLQILPMI